MMYTTIAGDTYDVVSKKVFGDEAHTGAIITANPRHAPTVIFSAGDVLNIPALPRNAANASRPPLEWYRR